MILYQLIFLFGECSILSSNNLTGELPEDLANLTNLIELYSLQPFLLLYLSSFHKCVEKKNTINIVNSLLVGPNAVGLAVTISLEKYPISFKVGNDSKNCEFVFGLSISQSPIFRVVVAILVSIWIVWLTERSKLVVLKGPYLLIFLSWIICPNCESSCLTSYFWHSLFQW